MEVTLLPKCRTCLTEIIDFAKCASITDVGDLTRTIQEMIILCVPQMAVTLSCRDFVCLICLDSIKSCVKFIESCLEVEAKINEKYIESVKDEPSFGNDGKIEIVIENGTHLFDHISDEQDYMIKIESVEIEDKPVLISNSDDRSEINNLISSQEVGTSILENLLTDKKSSISLDPLEDKASTSVEDHENTNEEKKTICSRQSASVKALKVTRTHSLTKQNTLKLIYSCEFCKNSFDSVFKYKEHLKESHRDVEYRNCKPYYCEVCDLIFNSREKIIKHTIDEHGTACTICLQGFPSKETLMIHHETHPNKYMCQICEKGFRKTESLRAHMETHQDYTLKCSVCGKAYKTKSSFRQHMLIHKPDQRVMCDKCPKKFKYMMQLMQHQKGVHDNSKDFQCPECDKRFALKKYLDGHYTLVHTGEKRHQCELCGKKFARSDYLKNHRLVHTGRNRTHSKIDLKFSAKPLPCTICGKILKNIYNWKRHLNTHVRVRKYPCEMCGLKFMSKAVKDRHKATHTADPENMFVCPVCWKKMKTDDELQLHVADHNNRPKRHVCPICGKAFARILLLENHTFENHTSVEEMELKQKTILEDAIIKVKELMD